VNSLSAHNCYPEEGPIFTVILTVDNLDIPLSEDCSLICDLNGNGIFSTNNLAASWSWGYNYLLEFLVCPQFSVPVSACGFGELGVDGCWHFWGGNVSPPQPPYPVPVDLDCYFETSGDYVTYVRAWPDLPLDGVPDVNYIAESDTACISVQIAQELEEFSIDINAEAPYCINDTIIFSIPGYVANSANDIIWGLIEPGATSQDLFQCDPVIQCEQFTLILSQEGMYMVHLYVYYNGLDCPEYVELTIQVEATDDPCICIAPQEFLVTPDSPGIQNNEDTDNRPAYVVGTSATWTPTGNPFITDYGLPSGDDLYLNVDLIIPDGVILTIDGMNIHFAPDRRILVQRGAIANLIGTVATPTRLYGSCGSMWQGIQVEGTQTSRYFPPGNLPDNYGILNTRNVRVYDAIFGATNTKLPLMDVTDIANQITSFPFNPIVPQGMYFVPSMVTSILYNGILSDPTTMGYSGGMLQISDAQFVNCLEGVLMPWFKGECNVIPSEFCEGFIQASQFTSDGNLAYPFNVPDLITRTEAGIHILSYFPPEDERLIISDNRFDNLNYGIRIAGTERTDIDHNQFDNCSVGISILNYTYTSQYMIQDINITNNELDNCNINMQLSRTQARIVQNTINSTYIPPSGGLTDANNIGIFIQGSNAQVLSNTINFVQAGVVLLSNDTDPMLVSNNSFNANVVGVFAYGNNRHVQIVCNNFDQYAAALYALDYTSSVLLYPDEDGYLSDQGDCNPLSPGPADNFFGQFLGTIGWHIVATPYPTANNFDYWYRNETGFVPTVTVGDVTPVECISPFAPIPPRDILCGIIGSEMIMEDEEIHNISDEGLKNYEAMKKVYYYVYDQNDTLAAEGLLEDIDTYFGNRLLLNHYLIKGNFIAANNILTNLPDEREEEQRFIQLYQIYTNWRLSGRDLFQITTTEEDTIRQIAATTTQTATEARTLLYLLRGEEYPIDLPPIADLIDSTLFQNVLINFKGSTVANATGQAKVGKPYPNPASNQISIDYQLPKQEKASISFFNLQGVEISTQHISGNGTLQFATDKWSKGMYFYRVMLPNDEITYGKIVIIK